MADKYVGSTAETGDLTISRLIETEIREFDWEKNTAEDTENVAVAGQLWNKSDNLAMAGFNVNLYFFEAHLEPDTTAQSDIVVTTDINGWFGASFMGASGKIYRSRAIFRDTLL